MCAFFGSIPLTSVLETVTASAVFAFADVPDVNLVELTVHAVLVITALCHAAGYAAVHVVVHLFPSSFLIMRKKENPIKRLTNPARFCYNR